MNKLFKCANFFSLLKMAFRVYTLALHVLWCCCCWWWWCCYYKLFSFLFVSFFLLSITIEIFRHQSELTEWARIHLHNNNDRWVKNARNSCLNYKTTVLWNFVTFIKCVWALTDDRDELKSVEMKRSVWSIISIGAVMVSTHTEKEEEERAREREGEHTKARPNVLFQSK